MGGREFHSLGIRLKWKCRVAENFEKVCFSLKLEVERVGPEVKVK